MTQEVDFRAGLKKSLEPNNEIVGYFVSVLDHSIYGSNIGTLITSN